ncbi:coilin [Leuresthes tenuis]|uniref:coilin n=1 Tax=Leuresthes tenuis TaxID=355514 RepID=UPI003B505EB5
MSAHSNNFIRLRLYFDYPPPAAVGCRMCWMLVDLNACRVVADLESIIREKFEFSRRSILSLFVEDCYLPHTESIYVVRDNDNVRVKVDCLAQVNVHSNLTDAASVNCRKRHRDTGEDGLGNNGVRVEWKKKKKKKQCEEITPEDAKQAAVDDKSKKSKRKKHTKNKDKRTVDNSHSVTPKPAAAPQKIQLYVEPPIKSTKKPSEAHVKKKNAISSDSSSSSCDEDEAPKETAAKAPSSTPAASKAPSSTKPTQKKSHPPSSPSSETNSSSDTACSVKISPKAKPLPLTTTNSKSHQALSVMQSTNCAQKQAVSLVELPCDKMMEPQDTGSDEEIQLVIRQPKAPGRSMVSHSHWQGGCRGKDRYAGGRGEYGSAEDRRGQSGFESSYIGAQELSYKSDSLTNMSVVLQNGAESVPKQDYNSMPLLAAPPQVGQKIAFKLLELTENYTPEISEYKEGKIVSFDPNTKQIELELLNTSQAPVEPGKFDLVYQNPDGSERVEYAVSRGSWVTERWESLLEPRLII